MADLESRIDLERPAVRAGGEIRIDVHDLIADLMVRLGERWIDLDGAPHVAEGLRQRIGCQAHREIRLRKIRIELIRACGDFLPPLTARQVVRLTAERGFEMQRLGQAGKRFGQSGISGNRLVVQLDRLGQTPLGGRLPSAEIELVGALIDETRRRPFAGGGRLQLHPQRLGHFAGDLRLHRKNIFDVSRVLPRPDFHVVARVDQLERDLDLTGQRAHRTGQDHGSAQLIRDVSRWPIPIRARGRPAEHSQAGRLSQTRDEILGEAVGKKLLARVGAGELERYDGDDRRRRRGHRAIPHARDRRALPPRRGSDRRQDDQRGEPRAGAAPPGRERRHTRRRLARVTSHVENRADRTQLGGERRGRFVPPVEALGERLGDDGVDLGRHRSVDGARRRRRRLDDLQREGRRRRARERQPPREHLEQDDAERENVRSVVDRFTERLLGRHVRHRPERRAGARRQHGGGRFSLDAAAGPRGEPEVENLRRSLRRHHDVRRFDVAVDDPFGVRFGEGVCDLRGQIDRATAIERPTGDHGLQRLARNEFEHQKDVSLLFTDLVERGDVGMGQRGGRACFTDEPLAPLGNVGHVSGEHLDGDRPPQARVAGAIDFAHPARPDAVEDFVLSQGVEHETRRL